MFFKSKKKKRIIAIKNVFKVWIVSNISIAGFVKESIKDRFESFIKKDNLSIWYFIGASDSLTQREKSIDNSDFLLLTTEIFEDLGFDMDSVSDCIKSYVDNTWTDEEFAYLMLGGQACNKFLSVNKDNSGMFQYIEKVIERMIE